MSATQIGYEAVDDDTAPDHFQPLSGYDLTPDDIMTSPPVTATLSMSPEFTNPEGEDADRTTRDYVIVLEYPPGVDNTVVRMNDCPTIHGTRMFRTFLERKFTTEGYTKERIELEQLLDGEESG